MGRQFVAHDAVVRGRQSRAEVAPCAVPRCPVPDMAPRRRLIMAPYAEILPVADETPLAVSLCHEPMGERSPRIRMVARQARVVTGNAVGLFMAGKTGIAERTRSGDNRINGFAVIFKPVSPVRFRPGKGNPPGPCG